MNIDSYIKTYSLYLGQFIKAVGKGFITNETTVQKLIPLYSLPDHKAFQINSIEIRHKDFSKIHNVRPKLTAIESVSIEGIIGAKNGVFYSNCSFKIKGDCKSEYWPRSPVNSFHFDTDEDVNHSAFIHPLHHLQFGGRHVRLLEEGLDDEDADKVYGNMLVLDTPRISHPPLDVVLSIDFVLTYLLPSATTSQVKGKQEYERLVRNAQTLIWKPYFAGLSRYFDGTASNTEKQNAKKLVPQLYARS